METEVKPSPPHENGSKIEENLLEASVGDGVIEEKDEPKTPPKMLTTRKTRSRSRTPSKKKDKKNDDNSKTNLKKIDENINEPEEKKSRSSEKKNNKEEKPDADGQPAATNGKDSPKTSTTPHEMKGRSGTPQKKMDETNDSNVKTNTKKTNESVNGNEEKKIHTPERTNNKEDKAVEEIEDSSKSEAVAADSVNQGDKNTKELRKSPRKSIKNRDPSDEASEKPKDKETEKVEPEVPIQNTSPSKRECDMDPLVIVTDEPDPELLFDENSDIDSGKGSPIQLRCKTRRSHTRNIPTPKTPKSLTDSESDKNSVAPTPTPENLNDTSDTLDISTNAEVGSDSTRLDYMANDTSVLSEESSYLTYSRERSLRETLRGLSPRRPIRPLNDAYRQRAFRNNKNKSDLNMPYPDEDSVGLKRKRSLTPEERKKFKSESTSFTSYLSSPLSNFRSKFSSDVNSSTPKLTGYKDNSHDIHGEGVYSEVVSEDPDKKNWCSVM